MPKETWDVVYWWLGERHRDLQQFESQQEAERRADQIRKNGFKAQTERVR